MADSKCAPDTSGAVDLREWQADGHKITLELAVWTGRAGEQNGTVLRIVTECPEDSSCRRWREQTVGHRDGQDAYCWVEGEIEGIGVHDFLDGDFEGATLPPDWSSLVHGLEIEWRDEGEDGIRWRPAATPTGAPTQGFSAREIIETTLGHVQWIVTDKEKGQVVDEILGLLRNA